MLLKDGGKSCFYYWTDRRYGGFPDIWMNRIYQGLKLPTTTSCWKRKDDFYVAITRAKDDLFLITDLKGMLVLNVKLSGISFKKLDSLPFSVIEEITLCSNCHNRLDEGFAFCPYCGEKQRLDE